MIVKEFTNVYSASVSFFRDIIHYKYKYSLTRHRAMNNKFICVCDVTDDSRYDTPGAIIGCKCIDKVRNGASVFVNKKCIIRRDLIRQSGYKIVLDRSKADVVVIPSVKTMSCHDFKFDIWAVQDDVLYLMGCKDDIDGDDIRDNIRSTFESNGYTDIHFNVTGDYGSSVYFIPKIQSYMDILTGVYPDESYIQEYDLPIRYPSTMNLETLKLWSNIDDDNIRRQVLLSSDAVKYPCTTCMMLHTKWYGFNDENSTVRGLFKEIGYDSRNSIDSDIFDREVIQPEDWNLMQDFIMYCSGVSADGGYTKDIPSSMTRFILKRQAVRPMRIDTAVGGKAIRDILNSKKQ